MRCSTWSRLVISQGSSCPVVGSREEVSRGGSAGSGRDGRVRDEMDVGAGLGLTILRPAPAPAPGACPGRVGTGDMGKTEDMGETGSGSVASSSARE